VRLPCELGVVILACSLALEKYPPVDIAESSCWNEVK